MDACLIKILLYSALPKKMQGGIATWTKTYLCNCESFGIQAALVNCEAKGVRAENPEAKMSIKDELVRTIHIFNELKANIKKCPDIAHVNTSCGPFGIVRDCLAVIMLKRKGIKTIVHFHCDISFWVNNTLSYRCLKSICKNADKIIVLCGNSKNYLKKQFNIDATMLPNFVSKDVLSIGHLINNQCNNVLYVGGIQPDKGCYEVFEIAKAFPNYQFSMIGQVDERVDITRVPPNVHLLGTMAHEQVLGYLDTSDVFLFPSHSEGFSMALAEAMARGLPVVATDVGANADMLENIGGYICKKGDVSDMINSMDQVSAPDIRRKMSEWNIKKVKDNYVSDKVIQMILDIYLSTKEEKYEFV